MKILGVICVYTLLASTSYALAAKVPLSDVEPASSSRVVTNKFIIEVDSVSQIPGKRSFISVCLLGLAGYRVNLGA